MKKITGTISFVGSIVCFGVWIYAINDLPKKYFEDGSYQHQIEPRLVLIIISWLILIISVFHYTLSTRFWIAKHTALEHLDMENEIIKRQIEKKELMLKLENLDKKNS